MTLMSKKISIIFIVIILLLTGCNSNNNEVKIKANCKVFDCLNKIEPENTVDEINEIIGFDGDVTDEKYKIYNWQLNETDSIQVAYYSSDKSQIKIKYDKEKIKNKKVDFSNYEKIKEDLKKGVKYTYNDLTKKFKTKGKLTGKSSISKKYTWVSDNGSYLTATISNNDNRCISLIGKIK